MCAIKRKALLPNQYLLLGFMLIIGMGSMLLALPFAQNEGVDLSYIDALFTSASAVCVTGLVTVDVAATFSLFGRVVIALLILLGGLGFASAVMVFILMFSNSVAIGKYSVIKEAYNLGTMKGTIQVVKTVGLAALIFQTLGTIIEFFIFRNTHAPLQALGHAAFNTISAFNNAGFDIQGGYQSLTAYKNSLSMNLVTASLIIIGGTGFFVLADLARARSWKRLSLHSKIVLLMNTSLLLLGTLAFFLMEKTSLLSAFFQSTSARTAGFNTIDIGSMSEAGQFIMIILMFIGASPGSTGGGIKTTTAFALLLSLSSMITRRQPSAFKRKIDEISILKAFQVLLLASLVLCFGIICILLIERDGFAFLQVAFESVSAFATVGLSTGITPHLHTASKLVLMVVMFIGRVGPITIATSLRGKTSVLKYVEEKVFIG
ncbi:MAG: ATPase [Sphaerochaeta sp.]|nr:ATPase [Sphaerochaeta sp.]